MHVDSSREYFYHKDQGVKCFHGNRWILQNRKTSVVSRLKYFDRVVCSMVGFSSGHRAIYKDHLLSLDVSFRKLCRSIAAPPSNTDRSLEWHDGYHNWNSRVQDLPSAATVKTWSGIVCKQHWDLCCYVGCLPEHRWVQRVLAWNPVI